MNVTMQLLPIFNFLLTTRGWVVTFILIFGGVIANSLMLSSTEAACALSIVFLALTRTFWGVGPKPFTRSFWRRFSGPFPAPESDAVTALMTNGIKSDAPWARDFISWAKTGASDKGEFSFSFLDSSAYTIWPRLDELEWDGVVYSFPRKRWVIAQMGIWDLCGPGGVVDERQRPCRRRVVYRTRRVPVGLRFDLWTYLWYYMTGAVRVIADQMGANVYCWEVTTTGYEDLMADYRNEIHLFKSWDKYNEQKAGKLCVNKMQEAGDPRNYADAAIRDFVTARNLAEYHRGYLHEGVDLHQVVFPLKLVDRATTEYRVSVFWAPESVVGDPLTPLADPVIPLETLAPPAPLPQIVNKIPEPPLEVEGSLIVPTANLLTKPNGECDTVYKRDGPVFQKAVSTVVWKDKEGVAHLAKHSSEIGNSSGVKLTGKWNQKPSKQESRNGVLYYQTFGQPGYTTTNTADSVAATAKIRFGPAAGCQPSTTAVFTVDGVPFELRRELNKVTLPKIGLQGVLASALEDTDIPKKDRSKVVLNKYLADFSNHQEELGELLKKMNSRSRGRITRLLSEYNNGARVVGDMLPDEQIKIFVKSDELLPKAKPRMIVFVPSITWVMFALWFDRLTYEIKKRGHGTDAPRWLAHCGAEFFWASGSDQAELSEAFTRLQYGQPGMLVCGDDNVGADFYGDVPMYDTSQRGDFFKAQCESIEGAGFPRSLLELVDVLHRGAARFERRNKHAAEVEKITMETVESDKTRRGNNQHHAGALKLPSGVVWTLVFNSLGIVLLAGVYYRNLRQLIAAGARELSAEEKYRLFVLSCNMCGIKMEGGPVPEDGNGAEFLKGIFVRVALEDSPSWIWTPVPGRLFKVGKAIVSRREELTEGDLKERLHATASSLKSYLLPPLLDTWVSVWGGGSYSKKNSRPAGWVNIEGSGAALAWGGSAWREACLAAFESRYGLDRAIYLTMEEHIRSVGVAPAHFGGEAWFQVISRDYS